MCWCVCDVVVSVCYFVGVLWCGLAVLSCCCFVVLLCWCAGVLLCGRLVVLCCVGVLLCGCLM